MAEDHVSRLAGQLDHAKRHVLFQLLPPAPFHGEAVRPGERLPDHDVAVALEVPDIRGSER
jgi:hypothetical protein